MIDGQTANCTFTILEQVDNPDDGEDWDPYADDDTSGDWEPVVEDVSGRFEPQEVERVNDSSGDAEIRQARIFAPLHIDDSLEVGRRVNIQYRGKQLKRRISNPRVRSLDGVEGYCQIGLEDWGDS